MSKIIKQHDMRQANLMRTFSVIREKKEITRKEIQDLLQISWGGVSQIVSRLVEDGYIIEKKLTSKSESGRTPSVLCVNTYDNFVIGIDVNQTGIYSEVLNLNNEIIYRHDFPADFSSKESLLSSIYSLLDSIFEKFNGVSIFGIGISMQGLVDSINGISVKTACPDWTDVPLCQILSERYNVPSYIAHDPDCILFASSPHNDTMLLRIDNGIGMSVVKNGELISSVGMFELGNTLTEENGKTLSLGQIISMSNLEKSMNDSSRSTSLYVDIMTKKLAVTIVNCCTIFNLNHVLICGKMLEYKDLFFGKLETEINKYGESSNIVIESYDEKRAAYGAAILTVNNLIELLF